jgi:hypothetical protein
VVAADHALRQGELLLMKDDQLRAEARARGAEIYDPHAAGDPLEHAYQLLGETTRRTAMDRRLYRDRGIFGLQFDDRDEEIAQFFAIERALAPRRIDIPVRQGALWAPVDTERAKILWLEAEEIAKALDEKLGLDGRFTKEVANRVRKAAKPYPELKNFANSMSTNRSMGAD